MKKIKRYIFAALLLAVAWQVTSILVGSMLLPSPIRVATALCNDMQSYDYWQHVTASFTRILAALIISFITAVPIGLYLGMSPRLDQFAKPLIYLSYPVPKIVLLPLILLIFGIGSSGKIAMLALILFFQLLITTRDAARAIGKGAKYSLLSLGGSRKDLFIHVIWPACLPAIFTSLRIATGTVVAVLFFVESISTRYGLGFLIIDAWGRAAIIQIYTGMVSLALLGFILYETFDLLERVYCRWNRV